MKSTARFLTASVVAIVAATGVWFVRDTRGSHAATSMPPAPNTAHVEARRVSPSTVLAIDPTRASAAVQARTPIRTGPMQDFLAAKRYRPLWERLRNSPEGTTADGAYVLYRIARRCARMSDGAVARALGSGKIREQLREDFLKTLGPDDPLRDKRLAAFDNANPPGCDGLDLTVTKAELDAMLAKAEDAGSAEARAVQIGHAVEPTQRPTADRGTLTDAQIDALRQLAATGDPGALLEVGRIFSSSYGDLTLRDGASGPLIEPLALHNAWTLLACEYGYPCGEDNTTIQGECAFNAHCDASNVQDYLYYYAATPHDSQLMNRYEEMLRNAVETGDWSHFTFVRGPRPPNTPMYFWGSNY